MIRRSRSWPWSSAAPTTQRNRDATPESAGLMAIADGFAMLGLDDRRQLELRLPVYDALYAWAQARVGADAATTAAGVGG